MPKKKSGDYQYHCTRPELEGRLESALNKTLGEVDVRHVFDKTKTHKKITGIAGDVVEQSVIGYDANSSKKPDLVVDGIEVEVKTTGLRKSKKVKGFEAKECMTITAVSLDKIADEDFEHSDFWHKANAMLIVYYLYKSPKRVDAAKYAEFPIVGYQFSEFTPEEVRTLKNDWQLIHDYVERAQNECDEEELKKIRYPRLSSALRNQLVMIDTAPKYPHNPRFRIKRAAVTTIVRRHFGYSMEQLPKAYTSMADIDRVLDEATKRWSGTTLGDLARAVGCTERITKGTIEHVICRIFDAQSKRMADVELFAKAGLHAKSVVLTRQGRRTEDMKLFTIDFDEFHDPDAVFEESPIYEWFADGSLVCAVLREPSQEAPLSDNVFLGFRRVSFADSFINKEVRRTWDEIHDLVSNNKLVDVVEYDNDGVPVTNRSGVIRSAPNFPKSANHIVFVRGTSSDSTRKPKCVNGIRMYSQQLWIKGTFVAERLSDNSSIWAS